MGSGPLPERRGGGNPCGSSVFIFDLSPDEEAQAGTGKRHKSGSAILYLIA
jgi:hypothetical protein